MQVDKCCLYVCCDCWWIVARHGPLLVTSWDFLFDSLVELWFRTFLSTESFGLRTQSFRTFMSNAKSITRRFYDRLSRHFPITQRPRQIRLIIYSPIHPFRCMKETLTNQVIKWLSFIVRVAAIRSSLRECRNENDFLVSAAPASFPRSSDFSSPYMKCFDAKARADNFIAGATSESCVKIALLWRTLKL